MQENFGNKITPALADGMLNYISKELLTLLPDPSNQKNNLKT